MSDEQSRMSLILPRELAAAVDEYRAAFNERTYTRLSMNQAAAMLLAAGLAAEQAKRQTN